MTIQESLTPVNMNEYFIEYSYIQFPTSTWGQPFPTENQKIVEAESGKKALEKVLDSCDTDQGRFSLKDIKRL